MGFLSPWIALAGGGGALAIWMLWFAGRHKFARTRAPARAREERAEGTLETVYLPAPDGTRLEGWLCLPPQFRAGLVVMAPGLCGTKEGPLERFAWRFVRSGWGVLLLDYRSFGGSDGEPRHWVDPLRQIEDTHAAVEFVRSDLSERVDVERIVLWGTSFSGAAAVCTAADLRADVAAVIAQVPYLGGRPVQAPGPLQIAGYVSLATAELAGDALARLFGMSRPPVYITAYGRPGERCFAMSRENPSRWPADPGDTHPFWRTQPQPLRGGWENRMLVRGLQHLDARDPIEEIARVECPILLIGATRDDLIPIERIREAASRMANPRSRLLELDCGHFDPYVDADFEINMSSQLEFLAAVRPASRRRKRWA